MTRTKNHAKAASSITTGATRTVNGVSGSRVDTTAFDANEDEEVSSASNSERARRAERRSHTDLTAPETISMEAEAEQDATASDMIIPATMVITPSDTSPRKGAETTTADSDEGTHAGRRDTEALGGTEYKEPAKNEQRRRIDNPTAQETTCARGERGARGRRTGGTDQTGIVQDRGGGGSRGGCGNA